MRKARYKVFTMGSASHRLQRCLCVTETEGEEPLAFRITVEKRHVVGTENPVIADLPIGADARGQRTANVSEGRRRLFRARGGMAAFARTPVFPVAAHVGALSARSGSRPTPQQNVAMVESGPTGRYLTSHSGARRARCRCGCGPSDVIDRPPQRLRPVKNVGKGQSLGPAGCHLGNGGFTDDTRPVMAALFAQ